MDLLVLTREFPPHILGGISYHLSHLYGEVSEMGHDVTVISGTCKQNETISQELIPDNVKIHTVPFGSRRGHHARFPIALRHFLRDFDVSAYDVALAHTPIPFEIEIPVVTKYHDCEREERKYQPDSDFPVNVLDAMFDPVRRWVEQQSLATTDRAIFVSELCHEMWNEHYEIECPTHVVHNGIDTDIFYPRSEKRKEYVLFVGGSERKGISKVLDYAERSSYEIKIAGASDLQTPTATVLGRVSPKKLARLYSEAIATIHPANFEAFGNIVLESLGCGTPVVTTERCGASAILDESCGIVTEDLEYGVRRATELNPKSCVEAAQEHTWRAVAEDTLEIISQVTRTPYA
ncbi:glycosyltransferase family 4 protein [Halomicroarcula sp. F13]|uniref:Glycosyltransferase family 4 protein n=1 Tax=Haloarcula rubra TaxID=2487747 RepID=A0AAW4PXK3_9EURY|nr:glycosyltransferase family 4 protein [Halomicroarcula rubra]MBX0325911.1 glycosyltransferase family 4 protein [Halomicroarcula rubra]